MCLPTMTQAGCEHTMQCVTLVHADTLRIAPQRQTDAIIGSLNIAYLIHEGMIRHCIDLIIVQYSMRHKQSVFV